MKLRMIRWRMMMSRGGRGWCLELWCLDWWCWGGRWWDWGCWCGGGGSIPRPRAFVRACDVKIHINMSQEPFHTEICRKKRPAQLEQHDQAPAFTLTLRSLQCGRFGVSSKPRLITGGGGYTWWNEATQFLPVGYLNCPSKCSSYLLFG